jgi:hypothetical protein
MPKKRGRPTVYSQRIADQICDRLAEGEQLDVICSDPGMPPASTVRRWACEGREPFSSRYARARSIGYERLAFELLAISDADCTGPDGRADHALVQKQRLQADTRRWLLSKLLPRTYGDKVTQELIGNPDQPIVSRIELVPVAPRPRLTEADAEVAGAGEASVTQLRALPSR